jgi:carbon monoxide dehydrogenase subunit G
MNLSGSHSVPVPADRAWNLLQDPAILAKCMPGCQALDLIGENEYQMRMKMMLASVSGLFDGKVRIAEPNPPTSYKLVVEGSGKIGFMKGEGLLTLKENGSETTVDFNGEVQVGGTIASVGQRLIDTTARLLIKRFFSKLSKEVENGDSDVLHSRT